MYRGTTPTLTFTLPIEAATITALNIALAQRGRVLVSRSLADVKTEGNEIETTLTEAETLALHAGCNLQIQLRVGVDETRMASQIFDVPVERILQEGKLDEL